MHFNTQSFNPSTLPNRAKGQPHSPVKVKLLPNNGNLSAVEILGNSNGLSVSITDANNNEFTVSGTPTEAGDFPITVKATNSAYGDQVFTY